MLTHFCLWERTRKKISLSNFTFASSVGLFTFPCNRKSEQGFVFCLDSLKKKIAEGASDEDTLILYAQTLDRFGLFLLHVKRPNEAVKFLELALEVAESVLGNLDNKIGVSKTLLKSFLKFSFSL